METVMREAGSRTRRFDFYSWMAVTCMLVAFAGFIPTYWMPMAKGFVYPNPVVHLHAFAFFSWTIFFIVQASLVPSGRVALHRSVGLAGIALGTLLVVMGLLASLDLLRNGFMAHGLATAGESFLTDPLAGIATFAVFFTLAIRNIRRPERHKRYMLLAMISVLNAPIARPLVVWVWPLHGAPPSWIYIPSAWLSYILIVVAMIYDWRKIGRPHRIYMVALPVLLIVAAATVPLSHTPLWHTLARHFAELAGPLPAGS
jgi:hypothetical protein